MCVCACPDSTLAACLQELCIQAKVNLSSVVLLTHATLLAPLMTHTEAGQALPDLGQTWASSAPDVLPIRHLSESALSSHFNDFPLEQNAPHTQATLAHVQLRFDAARLQHLFLHVAQTFGSDVEISINTLEFCNSGLRAS